MLGLVGCVLLGSLIGTYAVVVVRGCIGQVEWHGLLAAPGPMPTWQRVVGLSVVLVVAVLTLRWALAPTGARRGAAGFGWLVLVVAANPLWNLTPRHGTSSWPDVTEPGSVWSPPGVSLHGLDLGPGGVLVLAAMVIGFVVLALAGLLGRRPERLLVDDRRPEPLNAAEVAAWIHRTGSAVVTTTGPDGTPDVRRVAVAVATGGRLIFDTDRDARLVDHLARDPRATVLIDVEPAVRVRATATVVVGVERDQCLAVYLARFPDRLGRALSDRTAHVVLDPTAYDPV